MKNDSLFLCGKTEEFYDYSISLGVVPDELLNALYDAEKYVKSLQAEKQIAPNVSNSKVYHSV
jgi:hypothetical protein